MNNDILMEIENIRKKLDDCVERKGLNSQETREISDQIDELINIYYRNLKK